VAGPGEAGEAPEIRDDLGAEGIQMEVADQFQEVRLLLHHDGLVPVLEEVPDALMAAVEGPGVAGEQRPHAPGQGAGPRPNEEVRMIREERPGIDGEGAGCRQRGQAGHELGAVGVVPEDGTPL
jgi:hypothetical protein